jgi:hypothetical protein
MAQKIFFTSKFGINVIYVSKSKLPYEKKRFDIMQEPKELTKPCLQCGHRF